MGAVCVEQLEAEKSHSAGLESQLKAKDEVIRRERGVGPQPHHMADLFIGQQQGAHSDDDEEVDDGAHADSGTFVDVLNRTGR